MIKNYDLCKDLNWSLVGVRRQNLFCLSQGLLGPSTDFLVKKLNLIFCVDPLSETFSRTSLWSLLL